MKKLATVLFVLLFASPSYVHAHSCVETYQKHNQEGKFDSEIRLAQEIEREFEGKDVVQITEKILGASFDLFELNRFADRFSRKLCPLSGHSQLKTYCYEIPELLLSVVLHYQSGNFCPLGVPRTLREVRTSLSMSASPKDFILNTFKALADQEKIQCEALYTGSCQTASSAECTVQQILTSYKDCRKSLLPPKMAFVVNGRYIFFPELAFEKSVFGEQMNKGWQWERTKFGNAIILKTPQGWSSDAEFEAGFAVFAEALVKNTRVLRTHPDFTKVKAVADYLNMPQVLEIERTEVREANSIFSQTYTKAQHGPEKRSKILADCMNIAMNTGIFAEFKKWQDLLDSDEGLEEFFNDKTIHADSAQNALNNLHRWAGFDPNSKDFPFIRKINELWDRYEIQVDGKNRIY